MYILQPMSLFLYSAFLLLLYLLCRMYVEHYTQLYAYFFHIINTKYVEIFAKMIAL